MGREAYAPRFAAFQEYVAPITDSKISGRRESFWRPSVSNDKGYFVYLAIRRASRSLVGEDVGTWVCIDPFCPRL